MCCSRPARAQAAHAMSSRSTRGPAEAMRLRARAPSSPLHHEPFLLETAEEPESSSNGSLPKQQRGGSRRRWAAALPTVMLTVLAALWVALVVAVVLGMELDTWRAARQVGKAGGHPVILGQGTATVGGRTEQASPLAAPSGVGWSGMGQPGSQPTRPGEGSGLDEWAASEPRVSSGSSGGAGPAGAPDEHWSAEAERLVREMERHVVEYGPAGSFWPAGCRWRASTASPAPSGAACDPAKVRQRGLMFGGVGSVWRCHDYEWWDESSQSWTAEQPEACRLQTASLEAWAHEQAAAKVGGTGSAAWQGQPQLSTWTMEALKGSQGQDGAQHKAADWKQESAADNAGGGGTATPPHGQQHPPGGLGGDDLATDVRCAGHYCAFRNLWYSGGRFYALQEPGSRARFQGEWQLGRNRQGGVLHVASAAEWARSVRVRVAPGETVLLDWLFFLHPTALGHWLESLLPLFSMLRHEPLVRRTPDRLLVLFQQRSNVFDWVRGYLAAVLGAKPGDPLPPLVFQQEVADPLEQPLQLLEGVAADEWVLFEQVLWPKDIYFGGDRGCQTREDARLLRRLVHVMHALPALPPLSSPLTRPVITLQRKSSNRRILNEPELVAALAEFGEVRVVEYGPSSTFAEQVAMAAGTHLLVSVHTSNLANALLLPAGAVVVEILQRNWAWEDIDKFFFSLTAQTNDIHHSAVRAQGLNETIFSSPQLQRLFGNWSVAECFDQDCVEALTQVDVRVDVEALRALIASRLELIRASASVEEAALPWPSLTLPAAGPPEGSGAAQQEERPVQLAQRLLDVRPEPDPPADVEAIWAPVRMAIRAVEEM